MGEGEGESEKQRFDDGDESDGMIKRTRGMEHPSTTQSQESRGAVEILRRFVLLRSPRLCTLTGDVNSFAEATSVTVGGMDMGISI